MHGILPASGNTSTMARGITTLWNADENFRYWAGGGSPFQQSAGLTPPSGTSREKPWGCLLWNFWVAPAGITCRPMPAADGQMQIISVINCLNIQNRVLMA